MKKIVVNSIVVLALLFNNISCANFQAIFQENSDEWTAYGDASWSFSNNELVGKITNGDGFVLTNQTYSNFILELEFNPDSTINSGVFIRCENKIVNPIDCYELNIWDLHPDQDNRTGAIVMNTVPLAYVETINKWNTYKIKAKGSRIQVWVNNTLTADTNQERLVIGYIGLQAKGTGEIRFRNLKIKILEDD